MELLDLVDIIVTEGIKEDFDVVVGVTGMEGSGKSTCAIQLSRAICSKLDKPFELRQHVVYSDEKAKELLLKEYRGFPIVDDEAVDRAHKYDWATEKQKRLVRLFTKVRSKGKVYFMCMPYFTDFSPYFRKRRLRFWIYVIDRGVALCFRNTQNQHAEDPWYNKEIEKRVSKYYAVGGFNIEDLLAAYRGTPTFVGVFLYSDLPSDMKKDYLAWKDENAFSDDEEAEITKRELKWKERTTRLVYVLRAYPKKIRLSWKQLSGLSGMNEDELSNVFNNAGGFFPSPIPFSEVVSHIKEYRQFADFDEFSTEKNNNITKLVLGDVPPGERYGLSGSSQEQPASVTTTTPDPGAHSAPSAASMRPTTPPTSPAPTGTTSAPGTSPEQAAPDHYAPRTQESDYDA